MSLFEAIALAACAIALAVRVAGRLHRLLHLLQLEHYEGRRLLLWLRRRRELVDPRELAASAALLIAAGANAARGEGWVAGALLLAVVPIAALGVFDWRREAIKPLVFTPRAKRLLALSATPSALSIAAALGALPSGLGPLGLSILIGAAWLLLAVAPLLLLGSNLLLAPVERAVNARYVRAAKRLLHDVDPLVVGITGSYGKTTTKMCVGAVLEASRHTLVTPASFNSYLGIVRSINEGLTERHQAFVAEMGMFRRGDIAQLCTLVKPSIGVITAIGPMHLERLGSIENIAAAKAELLQALPHDGHFITNGDDERCLALSERAHVPVTLFGVENPNVDVRASAVRFANGRTELDVSFPGENAPLHLSARLLGAHNVLNLLAAAALGSVLHIEPEQIVAALAAVRPPEHRLSPIENDAAGILVIDDAYNSNPDGAAAALEVLQQHDARRRLLVTPGMVELGEMEEELNRRFGEQAASVCDIVVLVGRKRTRAIREGLLSGGMSGSDIHVVADIKAATSLLATLTLRGDVILFENDLPDTYAEEADQADQASLAARVV